MLQTRHSDAPLEQKFRKHQTTRQQLVLLLLAQPLEHQTKTNQVLSKNMLAFENLTHLQ